MNIGGIAGGKRAAEMKQTEIEHAEKIGFAYAKGAVRGVLYWMMWIVLVTWLIVQPVRNFFNVGTDGADLNGFNRSGLTLHTDHGTGVEYLSAPGGALIRRAVTHED